MKSRSGCAILDILASHGCTGYVSCLDNNQRDIILEEIEIEEKIHIYNIRWVTQLVALHGASNL